MKTIILSGWAQPFDALAEIFPHAQHVDYSGCKSVSAALDLIAREAAGAVRVIGWSLGGALLMQAIAGKFIAPQQLVLLAAPLQFVASPDFSQAMDAQTFELFRASYSNDPERTARRFAGLIAKGDINQAEIIKKIGQGDNIWAGSKEKDIWLPWLGALEAQRLQAKDFLHFPPTLIIHGQNDAIVHPKQSQKLAEFIPQAKLIMLPEAGHAPHLHDGELLLDVINESF